MKVIVLVKASKASEAGELPSQKLFEEMGKFNEELVNAGVMLAGEGLQPSSKGKRVRFSGAERMVIDGPFAETKELVAGFWLWNVKSMDEAVAWLKRCPNPHMEQCEVEIRPLFQPEDFAPIDPTGELRAAEARLREQAAKG
ncbi:MAG TPA: YciI family protein [Pirellulales bacterium]|nr:YciI family protein [Pirellulales bacterium]